MVYLKFVCISNIFSTIYFLTKMISRVYMIICYMCVSSAFQAIYFSMKMISRTYMIIYVSYVYQIFSWRSTFRQKWFLMHILNVWYVYINKACAYIKYVMCISQTHFRQPNSLLYMRNTLQKTHTIYQFSK